MRYLACLSLLFISLLCTRVRAQCTVGSVFIETQNDLDNFANTYNGCPVINGIIVLGRADGSPSDIKDLTPLAFLEGVLGQFFIRNTELENLTGLENLTAPGSFRLQNNDFLTTLEGLGDDPITTQVLEIDDCDQLEDIDRLALFTITNNLVITNNQGIGACNLPNICTALDNLPDNQTTISGNDGGCATEAIVREECFLDCHPDMRALAAIYDALDGPNWTDQTGWTNLQTLAVCDPCGFSRVNCNPDGRVSLLNLGGPEVAGALPTALGQLTELEDLALANAPNLSGSLPSQVGSLTKLKRLNMTNNGMGGALPATMSGLTALEEVRIINSATTGNFPDVGNWQNLVFLDLSNSAFTGPLPPGLNTIASLETFRAPGNNFSGPLYFSWVDGAALSLFRADDNQLDGPLPGWIGDYNGTNVSLINNNLSGCYPESYLFRCSGAEIGGTFSSFSGNPGLPGGGSAAAFLDLFCGNRWLCGVQCPSDPVTISSDAQAAQFKLTYPDCEDLPTSLTINGQGVTSIADLAGLKTVAGSVTINNTLLQNLQDFNVETVGDFLAIVNNANFSGDIAITDRPLRSVNAALNIRNNGLSSLTTFTNLNSLGRLLISNNDNLITLTGLEGVTQLEELELDDNDNLEEYSPLALTSVERLLLTDNLRLRDISALAATAITNELTITGNTSLSACDIASVCAVLPVPAVTKTISGNDAGCLSVAEVRDACPPCHPDIDALMTFYAATDGPNWTDNSGWAAAAAGNNCDPCDGSWAGITCTVNGRVSRINLQSNNLRGNLPDALGDLDALQDLTLGINPNLTGRIPENIFLLPAIQRVWLRDNDLMGGIPATVGNAESLRILNLSGNSALGGSIPAELFDLKDIEVLRLAGCGLTGTLPSNLENFGAIRELDLRANNLEGELPAELVLLTTLEFIDLSMNEFSGELPAEMGQLTALETLELGENNFEGTVPEDWLAPSIISLILSNNELGGPLPAFIGELPALSTLGMNGNNFDGCYPASYAALCGAVALSFQANPLLPEQGSTSWFNNVFCPDPVAACASLPVSWLSFTASVADKSVRLDWLTAEEVDNAGFRVERSADGADWREIGEVAPGGRTGTQAYRFRDEAPLAGRSYYRIRQLDFDGGESFSPIATVIFAGGGVRAWPNPFTGALTVATETPQTIQVVDIKGRVIREWRHAGGGARVRGLDLKSGVYVLRFLATGEVMRVVAR